MLTFLILAVSVVNLCMFATTSRYRSQVPVKVVMQNLWIDASWSIGHEMQGRIIDDTEVRWL